MESIIREAKAYEYKGKGIFEPSINIKEYLFKVIGKKGPITRSDMVRETGIPRTTIYDVLVKLMLEGFVRKFSLPSKKRGRPFVYYEVV